MTRFRLIDNSEIAIVGGFVHDNADFENCRPTRRIRKSLPGDRWVVNNWGGLAGVLKAANYYNGLPPYFEFTAETEGEKIAGVRLLIDSGHPENSLETQRRALRFVEAGGRMVMWSTSFRRAGTERVGLVREALGISVAKPEELSEQELRFEAEFPSGAHFSSSLYRVESDVTVERGRVIARSEAGMPLAWLIPYGRGEVIFFAGLPVLGKADDWTPWMEEICRWAGVAPSIRTEVEDKTDLPPIHSYAMQNEETGELLLVIFNDSYATHSAKLFFYNLPLEADWVAEIFHATMESVALQPLRDWSVAPDTLESRVEVTLSPMDLLLVKVRSPREK